MEGYRVEMYVEGMEGKHVTSRMYGRQTCRNVEGHVEVPCSVNYKASHRRSYKNQGFKTIGLVCLD